MGREGDAERIYLHHHEHLLWPLRNGAVLAGGDMQPIVFVAEGVGIVLHLISDPAKEPAVAYRALALGSERRDPR